MASPDQIKNILDYAAPMEVSPVEVQEKKVPAILRRRPSRDGPARLPFTYDTMINNVNQTRARLGRHPIESARSSQPASNVRKTALSYEDMLLNVNQARYNTGVAPIRDAVLSTQKHVPSPGEPSTTTTGSQRRAN